MSRISTTFQQLHQRARKALIPFVTAGDPDKTSTVPIMHALVAAGADILELGVPFSDPMADGPVIQRSSQVALEHGVGIREVLALVRDAKLSVPVVLFSYLNPIMAAGPDILGRAAEAGVHGLLLTDLPVGADPARESWVGSGPLAFVRLVAPTTPVERMREIARHGSGFVYLISRLGVTGMQRDVASDLPETIARLRSATDLPICAGFGVSNGEQAQVIGRLADGVVVGSAIVKAAESGVEAAHALTVELRRALDAL